MWSPTNALMYKIQPDDVRAAWKVALAYSEESSGRPMGLKSKRSPWPVLSSLTPSSWWLSFAFGAVGLSIKKWLTSLVISLGNTFICKGRRRDIIGPNMNRLANFSTNQQNFKKIKLDGILLIKPFLKVDYSVHYWCCCRSMGYSCGIDYIRRRTSSRPQSKAQFLTPYLCLKHHCPRNASSPHLCLKSLSFSSC